MGSSAVLDRALRSPFVKFANRNIANAQSASDESAFAVCSGTLQRDGGSSRFLREMEENGEDCILEFRYLAEKREGKREGIRCCNLARVFCCTLF